MGAGRGSSYVVQGTLVGGGLCSKAAGKASCGAGMHMVRRCSLFWECWVGSREWGVGAGAIYSSMPWACSGEYSTILHLPAHYGTQKSPTQLDPQLFQPFDLSTTFNHASKK